jgi:1-acyl-sn-glycerol-3-phosphate acyltransferase
MAQTISIWKLILGRVFALYALLVFVVTMLPALFVMWCGKSFLPLGAAEKVVHKVFQNWMRFYLPLIFCPVRVLGAAHVSGTDALVVICNHTSLMDVPALSFAMPAANKTLAKASFARVPLFGYMYKAGSILVDRASAESRASSYKKMVSALNSGLHLCLFPEGTRNKTSQPLQAFQDGAFKVAFMAQRNIVPAVIKGTAAILPAKGPVFWAWPSNITVSFLTPVLIEQFQEPSVAKRHCYDFMLAELQ